MIKGMREAEIRKRPLWEKNMVCYSHAFTKEGNFFMKQITEEFLAKVRAEYLADSQAHVLHHALAKTEMADLAYVPEAAAKLKGPFTVEVKTNGITAQEKSGRCWLFAALNILREVAAKNLNLEKFELSQNYLTFYDKLEKANNFLQMCIDYAALPIKGQQMQYVLQGMSDGGYWSQVADLIDKYGVVPKQVQPETFQSEHTASYISTINKLLRKDAYELREMVRAGKDPYARKEQMLAEVYKAQCIAFGQPVDTFDFAYTDKDKKYHCERNLTAKSFFDKYVGPVLKDFMPVTNEPVENRPMNTLFTFHGIENMAGRDMVALNLSQSELEELCVKQLKDGQPIWFACDAGAFGARKEGVWDPDSVDYAGLLGGFTIAMPKGAGLDYNAIYPNHAMLLTGVNFGADGLPDRWKIENSWGKEVGDDGYFVCSEKYFKELVFEVVVDKKHFTPEQLALLDQTPVPINAWEEDH